MASFRRSDYARMWVLAEQIKQTITKRRIEREHRDVIVDCTEQLQQLAELAIGQVTLIDALTAANDGKLLAPMSQPAGPAGPVPPSLNVGDPV